MSESFSEMFEHSLANQRIRPGMILMGLVCWVVGPRIAEPRGIADAADVVPRARYAVSAIRGPDAALTRIGPPTTLSRRAWVV